MFCLNMNVFGLLCAKTPIDITKEIIYSFFIVWKYITINTQPNLEILDRILITSKH